MSRTRTLVTALAVATALAAIPTAAQALTPSAAPVASAAPSTAPTHADDDRTGDAVRIVAPGERVAAGSGAEFWLTDEGKHWSTPELDHQFRSVVDGNIDRTQPGVSFQGEGLEDGNYLMSGLYYGTEDAAAVTVTTDSGTLDAHLIRLADAPDWGVWYVTPSTANVDSGATVTLHDADGDPLAELPVGGWSWPAS